MMTPSRWRADCSRCAALCCLSLAFDRGEQFGFDKPAGEPCALLAPGHACSIHAERAARGFAGCVTYDCYGAGQRVTEEVFGGRSWQAEPLLARAMGDAFWRMRRVHELALGLDLTRRLPLDRERTRRRQELEAQLDPEGGFSLAALEALDIGALTLGVRELLGGVRGRLGAVRRRLPIVASRDALGAPDHHVEASGEMRERGRSVRLEPVQLEHRAVVELEMHGLQRPRRVVDFAAPE